MDYEKEVLGATWEGFVIWAIDQSLTTEAEIKTMGISERASFADKNYQDYIQDLEYSYREERHFENMKYGEAM